MLCIECRITDLVSSLCQMRPICIELKQCRRSPRQAGISCERELWCEVNDQSGISAWLRPVAVIVGAQRERVVGVGGEFASVESRANCQADSAELRFLED